mmetsp:Transcript_1086/g.1992  ORF Transcript_1086/g.1992 Transcript_1086/m.1992 type:complete len:1016 (-) Transcript_1086:16-3063(-)
MSSNNEDRALSSNALVTSHCAKTRDLPLNSSDDVLGTCLHCSNPTSTNGVQVSCDDCRSWICNACHWCHEFQANHEIRVCDRCDAFYCRQCDEMDQCEDCSEVVCGNCSTLMSCKFCGCGLCEDCATACGRCGIVLCARDAKFAVECDTCKMSYCLVCLASGTKDPCVRCGHRPSKRVEQLVHLRLKSIYKAFKQSGAALTTGGGGGKRAIGDGKGGAPDSRVAAAAALARAAGLPGESLDAAFDSLTPESELALAGDVGAVLQAAAAAANSNSSNRLPQYPFRTPGGMNASPSNNSSKAVTSSSVGSRTEEEAKAAEAALLAELDREEEEKNKKSKKTKKKKSKKEALAKEKAEKEERERLQAEEQQRLKEELEETERRIAEAKLEENKKNQPPPTAAPVDEMEEILEALIAAEDISGIESFLHSLKGVPGKAALRKNAKKAIRRLNPTVSADNAAAADVTANASGPSQSDNNARLSGSSKYSTQAPQASSNVNSSELLTVVSTTHKDSRTELVSTISPSVVGWVIGKGGMRIREMMEKSSTKIWIDQDSMKADENRIMYISGKKNSVESAYRMVEELVSKSPAGLNNDKKYDNQKKLQNTKPNRPPTCDDFPPPSSSGNDSSGPPPSVAGAECVARLTCEPRFVALLIGRRGWTVKHIQDVSGARVDIDQTVTPREVTISGTQKSVASAQRLVRDVLSYPNAQLHYDDKSNNPSGDTDSSAAAAAKAQVEAAAKAAMEAEEAAKALDKIQKQQAKEMDRLKQLKMESEKQEREQQQQRLQAVHQEREREALLKRQQQQQQLQQQQQQQQEQPDLAMHARNHVLSDSESSGTENEDNDEPNKPATTRTLRPPSLSPPPAINRIDSLRPPSLSPSSLEAANDLEKQYSSILKDTRAMKLELASRSKKLTRKLSNGFKAVQGFSARRNKTKAALKASTDDDWSTETTSDFPKSPGNSTHTSKSVILSEDMDGEDMEAVIIQGISSLQDDIKRKKESQMSQKFKAGFKSLLKKKTPL